MSTDDKALCCDWSCVSEALCDACIVVASFTFAPTSPTRAAYDAVGVWPPTIAADASAALAVAFDPSCAPAPEADAPTPLGSVSVTEMAFAAPVALPPREKIAAPLFPLASTPLAC